MNKLNTIIVDNDLSDIETLTSIISDIPRINLVASYRDPQKALYSLTDEIDLIFLDVQMPNLSGLDFLRLMRPGPKVVLSTGHVKYALDGWNFDVTGFLSKPFDLVRLIKIIDKCYDLVYPSHSQSKSSGEFNERKMILLKVNRATVVVRLAEIVYVESFRNTVDIWTTSKMLTVNMPLADLLDMLPSDTFVQIHRSYVISLDFLQRVEQETAVLANTRDIPIRRASQQFMGKLDRFVDLPIGPKFKDMLLKKIDE